MYSVRRKRHIPISEAAGRCSRIQELGIEGTKEEEQTRGAWTRQYYENGARKACLGACEYRHSGFDPEMR